MPTDPLGGRPAARDPVVMRPVLALLGLMLLPGCVVVSVPTYHDGTAAGAGAALGGLIGAALDAAVAPVPPPGAIWDP